MRLIFALGLAVSLVIATSCSHQEALGPPEARLSRDEILRDLRKDAPALHIRELMALPDSTLPELESHFAQRAPHNPWLFGHLLARYGTARVFPQVRDVYDRRHLRWGCDSRIPFLAYFLRGSPTDGANILRSALKERKDNRCFESMLSRVSRIYPEADIEAVVINALDDPDPEVAADAAMTLSWYGSAASEPHLWNSLQRWTERWRCHPPARLSEDPVSREDPDVKLGDSLRNAIMTAQAWYFDGSRRRSLQALCWTPECRTRFEEVAPHPAVRIRVHQLMYDEPQWEVAWYHPGTLQRFRVKITQFPTGTVFGWCTEREGGGQLTRSDMACWRRTAKQVVEAQGFVFRSEPPAGSCATDRTGS